MKQFKYDSDFDYIIIMFLFIGTLYSIFYSLSSSFIKLLLSLLMLLVVFNFLVKYFNKIIISDKFIKIGTNEILISDINNMDFKKVIEYEGRFSFIVDGFNKKNRTLLTIVYRKNDKEVKDEFIIENYHNPELLLHEIKKIINLNDIQFKGLLEIIT